MYVDLYNPDAKTMPFLSRLYEHSEHATLVERYYVTEANTVHSLFAMLCGARPPLGVRRQEFDDRLRLQGCVPSTLHAHGIHTAFYTTSKVGHQAEI